jgi:hypothetical protein
MIDKDGTIRLHVWHGKRAKTHVDVLPWIGFWHLLGVVVRPDKAEFWNDGKDECHRACDLGRFDGTPDESSAIMIDWLSWAMRAPGRS